MKGKNIIYILDTVFCMLSVCVFTIVLIRYMHNFFPKFLLPYAPYYLGFFGIANVWQAYSIFLMDRRGKDVSLLLLLPCFFVFFAVIVAGNERVSGHFSWIVIAAGIVGFVFVFVKLIAKVYSYEKKTVGSKF